MTSTKLFNNEQIPKSIFVTDSKVKGNLLHLPTGKVVPLQEREVSSLRLLRRRQIVEYNKYKKEW